MLNEKETSLFSNLNEKSKLASNRFKVKAIDKQMNPDISIIKKN